MRLLPRYNNPVMVVPRSVKLLPSFSWFSSSVRWLILCKKSCNVGSCSFPVARGGSSYSCRSPSASSFYSSSRANRTHSTVSFPIVFRCSSRSSNHSNSASTTHVRSLPREGPASDMRDVPVSGAVRTSYPQQVSDAYIASRACLASRAGQASNACMVSCAGRASRVGPASCASLTLSPCVCVLSCTHPEECEGVGTGFASRCSVGMLAPSLFLCDVDFPDSVNLASLPCVPIWLRYCTQWFSPV